MAASDHGDEPRRSPPQEASTSPAPPSPSPRTAEDDHGGGDDAAVADTAASPPPFDPLFTLLTNTTTNATVHPHVHYLFADDDPSILASTAPSTDDPAHRALIVDLAPNRDGSAGWSVSWASSLTRDFAVTDTQLSLQPHTEADADDEDADPGRGAQRGSLMLRIDGVEREPVDPNRSDSLPSSGSGPIARDDVDGLLDDFRRRMGVLKKVVGEGERRRHVQQQRQRQQDEERQDDDDAAGSSSARRASSEREQAHNTKDD
jgi:hypothetical protein